MARWPFGVSTPCGCTTASDTLRDQTAAAAVTWQLDADPTYSDGALALAFSAFETLVGGPGTDTFAVSGAQAATLVGGAGADVFQFGAGAVLTGAVDGGAGVDTLDEAAATTARQVTLTGVGSVDGFTGTEAAITGGFTNIDVAQGGTGNDTLTGLDAAATWEVDGTTTYSSTQTLTFAGLRRPSLAGSAADTFTLSGAQTATLRGGVGADVFRFGAGAVLTGSTRWWRRH